MFLVTALSKAVEKLADLAAAKKGRFFITKGGRKN